MSFGINVEISNAYDEAAGPTGAVPTELMGPPGIGCDPCASDLNH